MTHDDLPPSAGQNDESLYALDNVRLDLPIAEAANRSLAALIDYMLLGLLMAIWVLGASFALIALDASGWGFVVVIVGAFILNWGYFATCEIAFDGKTPGKMALGLRVVNQTGGKASASALIIRNFVRPLDNFVGIPMMAVDSLARRLGDRMAGTLVLRERRLGPSERVVTRVPQGWGSKEIVFFEAFLDRLDELEPDRAFVLGQRVVEWIHRSEPGFLEAIDQDDPVGTLKRAFPAETT